MELLPTTVSAHAANPPPPPPPPAEEGSTRDARPAQPSSGTHKLDYLDGLRGVASLMVLAYHILLMIVPAYVMAISWPEQRQGAQFSYNGLYRLPTPAERALLFFLVDGRMAVAVFFVLSGRVLVSR